MPAILYLVVFVLSRINVSETSFFAHAGDGAVLYDKLVGIHKLNNIYEFRICANRTTNQIAENSLFNPKTILIVLRTTHFA